MEKEYMLVNLQLFAEDEEDEIVVNDDGYSGDKEEEILEEETNNNELNNDDDEEDETVIGEEKPVKKPQQKDKKEHAIIKQKKENKRLRDELDKLKQAEEDRKLAEQKEKQKQKFIDKGYDEEEATERAEEKIRVAKMEKELKTIKYGNMADKLSTKYPDIHENLDRLVDLCEKTGWSLEKVARAELEEASEFDIKTKTEQEALLRRQKAESKKVETGTTKAEKATKLSASDERTYQNMIQQPRYKNLTRKQYLEILED